MKSNIERIWSLLHEPEGPLAPYLNAFAESLEKQGFKRHLIGRQIRVAAYFSKWLQTNRVAVEGVTDAHVQHFFKASTRRRSVSRGEVAAIRRLIDCLMQLGVIPLPAKPQPTSRQAAIDAYSRYLRDELALSVKTAIQYNAFIEKFLSERFGDSPVVLSTLCAEDVIGFIKCQAARLSPARAKAATIALRSFLRYLHYRGELQSDLAAAVPTVPNWSMTGIPRAIAAEHVQAVLTHCPRDTPVGLRDYAILLLLARLGLRACEIVSLTLDSIVWEAGRITVIGKGGQADVLPLPADVGEAIARYLQEGRPACRDRTLFLRVCAPVRGLGASQTIGTIVRTALMRAGIETPHYGTHQFRHALATAMLRQGATLHEIGSLLRHRHPKTTGIYTKVDLSALRLLSLAWPGGA